MFIPALRKFRIHRARIALRFAVIATLGLTLQACSVSRGLSSVESEPQIITASITNPVKAEGIDSTDAEAIKTAVVKSDLAPLPQNVLAWSNPGTGNRGTIKAIEKFVGSHGQQCRKFQTTVDSFSGVSLYNGEACELKADFWVLSWFSRDNS